MAMNRQQLAHTAEDAWIWRRAETKDVEAMVDLCSRHYSAEINEYFVYNPTRYAYHLYKSCLQQTFYPSQEYISVAEHKQSAAILAYTWCQRGKFTPYADCEMAVGEMLHVDLDQSVRTRLRLIGQTFDQWIIWCELHGIPVLCSTSIRSKQDTFMRLHDVYGFDCHGSFAYLRVANDSL